MRTSTLTILAMGVALLASNGWWLYRTIDTAVTHTYLMQSCDEHAEALQQMSALLPVATRPGSTPAQVVAAAADMAHSEPFEKDGFIRVGRLGLKFDEHGRLAAAVHE